ncbi:hypothetical protein Tco_0883913, partial [Tanacetum coccineum]
DASVLTSSFEGRSTQAQQPVDLCAGFTEFVKVNKYNKVEEGFSIAIFCYALQLLPYNVQPIFKPFINNVTGEMAGTYDQLLKHIEAWKDTQQVLKSCACYVVMYDIHSSSDFHGYPIIMVDTRSTASQIAYKFENAGYQGGSFIKDLIIQRYNCSGERPNGAIASSEHSLLRGQSKVVAEEQIEKQATQSELSQPIESTQRTHRTPSAPRPPNPQEQQGESSAKRKFTIIRIPKRKLPDPTTPILRAEQIDVDNLDEATRISIATTRSIDDYEAQQAVKKFFDDTLTYDATLSCKPTVSPLNENEIDFRISFDESDDEDYMVIFDNNSFSYKIIYVDNLKTNSENDNDKVDMPSFPSPESTVSYSNDSDYFKDFETEFPAIVYNDSLTSKLDSLTEPAVSHHNIDKLDLKNETSLSEYDEEEQNIMYFNDLFSLNIIYPNDLKSDKDNDDDELDIKRSSGDVAPLPPRDQRHPWLRMCDTEMGLDVADTLCFQLGGVRHRMTWRQFILALGLHTVEEMVEDRFEAYWLGVREDPVRRLCHRMISCSISGRGQAPEKVAGINLFYLRSIDRGTANVLYLLAQYLSRYAEGRKSGARLSVGHFIGRLAAYFGLVSDEGLRGLSVITRELPMIDLHELVRLNICERLGDTWAWVAPRPERQSDAAAGASQDAEDVLADDEGALADPTPMQAPQPPQSAPRTIPQRIARLKDEVHELRRSIMGLRGDVDRSITDQGRFATWMVSCMT